MQDTVHEIFKLVWGQLASKGLYFSDIFSDFFLSMGSPLVHSSAQVFENSMFFLFVCLFVCLAQYLKSDCIKSQI
jgi:hypothetical protein